MSSTLYLAFPTSYGKENNYPVPDTKGIKYPQKSNKQIDILSKENRINLKRKIINSEDNVSLGILFTLFTGIRIGELCGLKWEDIDLSSGVVTIKRTIERIADLNQNSSKKTKVIISNPKTGSSLRTIPLPDFLCSYLLTFKRNDNFYFLTASEKYIEPTQFYVKYKKFMSNLGMGQFTFHSLRHTFATNCVELGFDIKSLSEILGHANITTTLAIYVHPTMKQKRKQMNLLTPISL